MGVLDWLLASVCCLCFLVGLYVLSSLSSDIHRRTPWVEGQKKAEDLHKVDIQQCD